MTNQFFPETPNTALLEQLIMFRAVGKRSITRNLRSASIRRASTKSGSSEDAKSGASAYRIVNGVILGTLTFYIGGSAIAMNNESFGDFWDKYVPGGEKWLNEENKIWVNRDGYKARAANLLITAGEKIGLDKIVKLPPKEDTSSWPVANPPLPQETADKLPAPQFSDKPDTQTPGKVQPAPATTSPAPATTAKDATQAAKDVTQSAVDKLSAESKRLLAAAEDEAKALKAKIEAQEAELKKTLASKEAEWKKALDSKDSDWKKTVDSKDAELKKVVSSKGGDSPWYHLSTVNVPVDDPNVKAVVDSVNSLITSIDDRVPTDTAQKQVDAINQQVAVLSKQYDSLVADRNNEYADKVKATNLALQKQYGEEYAKKTTELTAQLTETLDSAKKEMDKKYDERLKLDVTETAKTIMAQAESIIQEAKIKTVSELSDTISAKVVAERDGKLANLDALHQRVQEIEAQEVEMSKAAESLVNLRRVEQTVSSINQLLSSNESSATVGQALVRELTTLKRLVAPLNNDVINASLNSLPSDESILTSGGVLTQSQLISRWQLLAPQLREVSLLPPNAGVLGYMSSWVFSKLLVQKSGSPVKDDDKISGADVESVIARVNNYLTKNELDNAVEEVTNLKGWPRQLADDWVSEGRKKLELQFLMSVVSTEMQVMS